MKARIETSGTHIKDGFLKVRIDLYPDPEEKTYPGHYTEHFDDAGGSLGYAPNPCLCHFVAVPADITREQLLAYIGQLFTPDCLATLDDALVRENAIHLVSPYMRAGPGMAAPKVALEADKGALVGEVNSRLVGLELSILSQGKPEQINPQSIDIGPGDGSYTSSYTATNTWVDLFNPASAAGTLDTWQMRVYTNATGVSVATFVHEGSNVLSTRDHEDIGNVNSGSLQTFSGLSTDVGAGDYAGMRIATGNYFRQADKGVGHWYATGDQIPCSHVTFSYINDGFNRTLVLYATGTESGGGVTEKTSAETGAGTDSVSGRGLAGGEAGSGAESRGPRAFSLPDGGSGVEGAVAAATLLAGDTGQGAENAHILGLWEVLFSNDTGFGADALKAVTARTGPDIRLRPACGRVDLPHKEVNR
jgi:hypothetical protein